MIDPAMTSPGLSTDEPKSRAFLSVQEAFIPSIKVFGAGGAGGNVVTKMVDVGIRQVEMVICNTDLKALQRNKADHKIELGKDMTRGLGAGARPEVGTNAAEETASEIEQALAGAHMVFIAAGMGGGTGTGAAPVVARIAKARQILTVGVVTLPFSFEGKRRMQVALEGVEELRQHTDTLLVIPNDKLQDASTQATSLLEAFHMVDSVLINAIQGITDLLNGVGDINVDFADVQTIMENMGRAVIGRGTASGQDRLERAVHNAMHSSLMGNQDIRGARGILVHVVGPRDTSALEINDAMTKIAELADEDVNLIWGASFSEDVSDQITVTVIATGLPD
ncbi:MAG: cell division protein FtsZ [SAR324 cluster bacterium]|nr:cell division protein FtsZ [SAR324 cluster bacterium]